MNHNPTGASGKYVRGLIEEKIIRTFKNRFYSRITIPNEKGCMEFIGKAIAHGYGLISYKNKMPRIHRISYEMHCGKIPKGMHVLHKCDNRKCVAPEHLFLGTNTDNIIDRMQKNRSYHPKPECFTGKKNPNVVLTKNKVLKIRELLKFGVRKVDISKKFNVTPENLRCIELRKTWKFI